MSAMESRIEQRLKRQMDEMEKRMLDAINNLNRPRAMQNNHNNQAKAVPTPDETIDDANFDESQDCSTTEEQVSRQDQVKILKLADKKQLSPLECGATK